MLLKQYGSRERFPDKVVQSSSIKGVKDKCISTRQLATVSTVTGGADRSRRGRFLLRFLDRTIILGLWDTCFTASLATE